MEPGANWLIADTAPGEIVTPERLSDEQRLIGRTAADFCAQEILPETGALEQKQWDRARALIRRCGELGLLGADVPESLGGVGLDKTSSVVIAEALGSVASFATTFGAQTGLAIMPLLWFGTEAQQKQYLPPLIAGEIVGAYSLSEAESGSDALAARAHATRQSDGSWVLNGEKLWITNGGLADLFVVFAKVDGAQFSAFLVERAFPGVSSGGEEHKMGLHGSSTTPLLLADAKIPAGNLLGEVGKGHKIAFNVLNYGRFKLAAFCSGTAKAAIGESARYALTRRQFDRPIAEFGAIRHKLAEMAIQEYAVESMLYRTAGLIDAAEATSPEELFEMFAIEASLLKVAGSEMLDYVVDENVQIHGGNGFVADYPAERRYRDARVNRIFEGTNEINRLLAAGMLLKRALSGGVPVLQAAKRLRDELLTPAVPPASSTSGEPLAAARENVTALKKTTLMMLGLAAQTFGERLQDEQEVLTIVSDLMRDTFAAESATLRASASAARPEHADAAAVFSHDACLRAEAAARTALSAMTSGDELKTMHAALRRFLRTAPVNTIAVRRRIADRVLDAKGYPFAQR